ncbi:MAG: DNA replication complex GINS protein PSF2 [Paramarteilia canceri]
MVCFGEFELDQCDFFLQDSLIRILPNFNENKLELITGHICKFKAGVISEVPLWVALYLKSKNKCKIVAPEWFTTQYWEKKITLEKATSAFTRMPHQNYYEMTRLLCKEAPDDIIDADKVRMIVKDTFEMRVGKLKSSISTIIEASAQHAKLNYLTSFELRILKRFIIEAMKLENKI